MMVGLSSAEHISQVSSAFQQAGRLRLAMLSYWHVHASEYARQALNNHGTALAAVWDEDLERGQKQSRALGIPFYEHLEELILRPDIDGVIVDTPTTMHRDVILAAAQAGKHIFTEKVLAPTLYVCHEIVAAVSKANVALMVSLPRLSSGSTLAIKEIFNQHLLGDITQVRIRLFHDGALKTLLFPQGWLPPAFFDPKRTQGALHPYLKPAADRFNELKEEEQAIFRKDLSTFIRVYDFLSQIVPYNDPDLERLHVYGKSLLPRLTVRRGGEGGGRTVVALHP